jgi:XTP/dITP diphosphohydrolase
MKLIFATNNQHKLNELKVFLGEELEIYSLKEAGINIEIPEPHDTLEENASEKSKVIFNLTGKDCFSEDTGLEIEALGGAPGVKSARYAGDGRSFKDNIDKVMKELGENSNRKARFRAVISLRLNGKETQFEGICEGRIISEEKGTEGFGYDPIFVPDGSNKTFAEMNIHEKNIYNHRIKAAEKLVAYLQTQKTNNQI